jgi:UDP-N-acetyl-2-amino-2-deoxyglucuronate dehydrogenase
MSNVIEPAFNDIWTIRGEEHLLSRWKDEDAQLSKSVNPMEYFHHLQIQDFLHAIIERRQPSVTGEDGRRTVELFTAIYRATRDRKPVRFPLTAE